MAVDLFLSAVRELAERNLALSELIHFAEKLKSAKQQEYCVQLYRLWIAANPTNALLGVAEFNLAAMLSDQGDVAGAKALLESAIAHTPELYPAYINYGSALERLGQADQAIAQWNTVIGKLSLINGPNLGYKLTALKQMGRVLEAHDEDVKAEAVLQQSLSIDPRQYDVAQHLLSLRLAQCKWPVVVPFDGCSRETLMKGISPLSLAAYTDDPMLQLATSWVYNRDIGDPAEIFEHDRKDRAARRQPRLKIGYVSSDLREHAIGFLMAELFELHDRSKVEVFAYYCGVPSSDAINARIKASMEHWVDISGMDDATAARRIAEDGIDILVDVNGYTRDARTKAFAMRPAPVQVNWLGFPGTMASPYHQYIIADDWIIPEGAEIYYSEKVVRLPCYQPNDRKRIVAPVGQTRAEAGLPDDAVVFCCFNGTQKISRFTFERWLTILERVPNSVLWLLDRNPATNERLRDFAAQRGIARERLVFAPKLANPYHLARYPLADLFLDTLPYGAHTTASDALWMGVPILTLSGRGFASRVCGSLARSAGLSDLICDSAEGYVELAVRLGNNPAELAGFKTRLEENRNTCVLFDMDLLASRLEALYEDMWGEYVRGEIPEPDLSNLAVYQEIGAALDNDGTDIGLMEDYHGWYRAELARRHRLRPIRDDRRLWTMADIAAAGKRA